MGSYSQTVFPVCFKRVVVRMLSGVTLDVYNYLLKYLLISCSVHGILKKISFFILRLFAVL